MSTEASASQYDVIVVGAGVGGLTAAALLAKAGKHVLVVEKEPRPGGYVGALVHGDYQFDTAARLIMGCTKESPLGPGPIYRLLAELGVQGQCDFVAVQPMCTIRLPGTSFRYWSGRQAFIDGLQQVFPNSLEGLPRLLDLCNELYRGLMLYATRPHGLLAVPFRYPAMIRYLYATVEDVLTHFIPDLLARTAVASLWPYIGLPPRRASFLIWATMMASYIEEGAFFCRGGLHRLADALASALIRQGGELLLGTEAVKMMVEDRAVWGMQLSGGQVVFAPVVVYNADCRSAFAALSGPGQLPWLYRARLARLKLSVQALDISLVTDLDVPQMGFGFENLIYDSWDAEDVWRRQAAGQVATYPVTVTTAVDPSLAPPGQHLISSILPHPANAEPSPQSREAEAKRLFAELARQISGLEDHLVLAKTGSAPRGYVTQEFGPIYGWEATPRQVGLSRLSQRVPIRDVYLAGHWTQPGHGVFTVVLSGMQVARKILGR